MITDLLFRLRAVFDRRSAERSLDDELRAHLDHEVEKLLRAGMSSKEASRKARLALGGMDQVKEECRDAWGTRFLDDLRADVRYAVRSLSKNPAFSVTAILTLAVGIGANTGLFTMINMLLLRPTPVKDPQSLYQLTGRVSKGVAVGTFSFHEYRDIETLNAVFVQLMADSPTRARSNGRTFGGYLVSGNYFSMLGGGTVLGRPIEPKDAKVYGPPVIVIGHAVWLNLFGGDPQIVGRQIELAGGRFTVIGVAAPGFTGIDPFVPDFWAPINCRPLLERSFANDRGDRFLRVVGRLRPGVTPGRAELAMTQLLPIISESRPAELQFTTSRLESRATYQPWNHADLANVMPILTAFALILLIAASNLGNVLLARAMHRQREIGLRLSLGAGRSRVVRQLLTESAVLGLWAGIVGLVLSQVAWTMIHRAITSSLSSKSAMSIVEVTLDYRVFAFTFVLSLMTGVLFGLAPSLHATRSALASALKADGSVFGVSVSRSRFGNGLVVVQFALSLVLLISAGLLLRSATQFQAVEPGYDVTQVISVQTVQGTGNADPNLQQRLAERLRATAGISLVAHALQEPLRGSLPKAPISLPSGPANLTAGYNEVSPEYFAVLGISILRGRVFTDLESSSGAPVAVVSQSTARRFWPAQDPIGRTIRISTSLFSSGGRDRFQSTSQSVQIIGIAKDVVSAWLWDGPDETCVYLPAKTGQLPYYSLLVRGNGMAKQLAPRLRAKVNEIDPTIEFDVRTMEEVLEFQVLPFRLTAWGAAAIGGLGLLLACIGIYGVMAFAVSQRTKEIGIRIALGASRADLLGMMLREGGQLIGVGMASGLVLAFAFSRVLGAMLFKVRSFDPPAFLVASLVLGLVGILATLIPSVRACQVNANIALKYE